MAANTPLLKLVRVTKRFESPEQTAPLTILQDISLEVSAGESLAIVGPSGSGKSTLLHIIGTLDRASEGQVILSQKEVSSLTETELASVRNRQVGFVFQAHYLLPQCTVLENVLVPTLAKKGDGTQIESSASSVETAAARAERLLARVGLSQRMSHRPAELSGGERQRVAVVRALINQPQLLLADEPTGALDHASAQELGQLLVELNREEKVTLIVVTHALELAKRMGRMLRLTDRHLIPAK